MSLRGCFAFLPFHFDADSDPDFHFDTDPNLDPAFHFDADQDPAFQNDADPDLQHCLKDRGNYSYHNCRNLRSLYLTKKPVNNKTLPNKKQ
jgi:hypothetical protein